MTWLPKMLALPEGIDPESLPDEPVQPRDAATVMLVRDDVAETNGGSGLEVFLLNRAQGMAFARGMTVFPGGGVDSRDGEHEVPWTGPPPQRWCEWFGCAEPLATALVCAAVRETFEESGVLLAGRSRDSVVADTTPYHQARAALVSGELSLARFLADEGLTIRADLLRPWSSWVTPPQEKRRYDARFFLAALPQGQLADGATTEAESAGWFRPADALAAAEKGRMALMAPTFATLSELDSYDSVDEALAADREVSRYNPVVVFDDDGAARVVLEGEDG